MAKHGSSGHTVDADETPETDMQIFDDEKLVNLMIDYEYKVRSVPTYVIDEDYFGE